MYYLLEFVRKYHYVLLFVALEVVSFVLLFRFNKYQGSVWLSGANTCVAETNRLYDDAVSYLELRNVNSHLTDENVRLQMENSRLRDALLSATHDTTYTEKKIHEQLADYQLVPAVVVSNLNAGTEKHALVIDRGSKHGVKAEMGVVGGGGVVGIVVMAGENYSLVIPATNKKSSISCRIRQQDYFGFLQWEKGSLLKAHLNDIPRYARVKAGSVVETSGFSSVFPPGIFVGRVAGVKNSADGQSYRLDVTLGTDFARIRNVNVITTPYKAEIDTLQVRAVEAELI